MFFDYHFKVEQEAGSATFAFFSFNGTAGVWRTTAINEAGGWKDRTTVEDMDLAVRASLNGWKFIYVGDIRVKSELPSTYGAYCRQQFRWACGGANLFRKIAMDVLVAKVSFFSHTIGKYNKSENSPHRCSIRIYRSSRSSICSIASFWCGEL
jgi:beta-mannan synthase